MLLLWTSQTTKASQSAFRTRVTFKVSLFHTHQTVIDFGSAVYDTEKRDGTINTRQYRAPEVLVGMEWDEESDIWGVACIAMELFTGELLFKTVGVKDRVDCSMMTCFISH